MSFSLQFKAFEITFMYGLLKNLLFNYMLGALSFVSFVFYILQYIMKSVLCKFLHHVVEHLLTFSNRLILRNFCIWTPFYQQAPLNNVSRIVCLRIFWFCRIFIKKTVVGIVEKLAFLVFY